MNKWRLRPAQRRYGESSIKANVDRIPGYSRKFSLSAGRTLEWFSWIFLVATLVIGFFVDVRSVEVESVYSSYTKKMILETVTVYHWKNILPWLVYALGALAVPLLLSVFFRRLESLLRIEELRLELMVDQWNDAQAKTSESDSD